MRKADRQVSELPAIFAILDQCKVCRLAMVDGGAPYVVPLNFGYREEGGTFTFYFHCAKQGRKLDILRRNPAVCLEMDCGHKLVAGRVACLYSYLFQSVIATGSAQELTAPEEKADGLACIMHNQTGKPFAIAPKQADSTSVWRVRVTELTAKAHTK